MCGWPPTFTSTRKARHRTGRMDLRPAEARGGLAHRRLGLGAARDRRLRFSTPSLCLSGLTLSNGPRPQLRLIHRIGVRPRTSSQIPRRVLFLRLRAGVVQW